MKCLVLVNGVRVKKDKGSKRSKGIGRCLLCESNYWRFDEMKRQRRRKKKRERKLDVWRLVVLFRWF